MPKTGKVDATVATATRVVKFQFAAHLCRANATNVPNIAQAM
jgi:hypothetical protein